MGSPQYIGQNTGLTTIYWSDYRVHHNILSRIQGSLKYTVQNTGFTTIYWSKYRVHHNILVRIQGSPQYIVQNTGFTTIYCSEYRVHHNILFRIQGSSQYIGQNTGFSTIYWPDYRVLHNILVRIQGSPQYIGQKLGNYILCLAPHWFFRDISETFFHFFCILWDFFLIYKLSFNSFNRFTCSFILCRYDFMDFFQYLLTPPPSPPTPTLLPFLWSQSFSLQRPQ